MCEKLLLTTLRAALRGETAVLPDFQTPEDGWRLYELACAHRVQALVLEAMPQQFRQQLPPELLESWRQQAKELCVGQTLRDDAFSQVYGQLTRAGVTALVMKGALCRNLYPQPCLRPSSDEDLLVPPEQFETALELLRQADFRPLRQKGDAFEIGLMNPQGLYLELHKSPFAPDFAMTAPLAEVFSTVWQRAVPVQTEIGGLLSMSAHDHMLYLLLHACKHMVYSGFGIRQVCDIALWAQRFGAEIDWPLLWRQLESVRALTFGRTVLAIAAQQLGLEPEQAGFSLQLEQTLPAAPLLEDILQSGVYGSSSESRLHSAGVTLQAVQADRQEKRESLLPTLFPDLRAMQQRYGWLRRAPVLLPVAWACRLLRYARQNTHPNRAATQSLQLARQRKALLQQLDLLS